MFEAAEGDTAGGWGEKKKMNLCLAACESTALLDCSSPLPCSALLSLLALPPVLKQAEIPAVPVSWGSVDRMAGPGWERCGMA